MLNRMLAVLCRWLDTLAGLLLAVMVVLVFGNVVLRYAFNSGIALSEELSRWLFVWITFLSAAVALRERRHLGTDALVGRLPRPLRKACLVLSCLLMLWVDWLLFEGSLAQVKINWTTASPVMEVPVAIFYASGMAFAILAALILLADLLKLLSGQVTDADLLLVQDTEELQHQTIVNRR